MVAAYVSATTDSQRLRLCLHTHQRIPISKEYSTWSLEMDQVATELTPDRDIEIIPPPNDKRDAETTTTCLCCKRKCPTWVMDSDGCGICEECLAP